MDRARRWFKGLFGIKSSSCSGSDSGVISNRLDRSLVAGLCDSYETIPPNISAKEAAWLRSFYTAGEEEKERRTHAIAVAEATAAAADAAVAAAKAAAVVVRLTGQGKSGPLGGGKSRESRAALQIQCAFRGYLARKALRALKGVVKIQALVRGYLVRKQAAATLRSMEALLRAQASVKFQRALRRVVNAAPARKSTERFSGSLENRSNGEETAKIVEVDTGTRPGTHRIRGPLLSDSDIFDNPFRRTLSSPLSGRVPPRLSMPKPVWDECSSNKFPTAQSTPRFVGGSPSRSMCCSGGEVEADAEADAHRLCFLSGDFHSSYMADTTSFTAKLRSHSAPRQRPETKAASGGWRRSIGGGCVPVQRPSCSGVREAVVGNIERRRVQCNENGL